MIIFIALIPLILAVIWLISNKVKWSNTVYAFARGNVIVFGRKGCGKDLIFQGVINTRRKPYMSNISYGGKGRIEDFSQISVEPNTYENFINGNITKIQRNESNEGIDFYISDGGVYLPSQYSSALDKTYKSLPIYYALSRHLYNSNVHVNTQALSRVWNKLREQADSYVQAIRTYTLPFLMVTKYRVYDKYETALSEIRPYRANGFSRAELKAKQEEFRCRYGKVYEGYLIQRKKRIKYNTRYFKGVMFEG